jgi:uncharacterized protein (TIGR01732 family)
MSWGLDWGGPGWSGYGYTAPVANYGAGNSFALIVVLFTLLIIVGVAWC